MWKQLHVSILYKNQSKDVKKYTIFTSGVETEAKADVADLSEFKFCLEAQKKPCFYKLMQQKVISLFVTLLCHLGKKKKIWQKGIYLFNRFVWSPWCFFHVHTT